MSLKVVLSTLNAKYIHSSLALRYIRAYGRLKGYEFKIAEYTINMPIYDVLREVDRLEAQVIGFCCYIWNIDRTLHLATLIKAVNPNIKIVLGGPEVSYCADEVLQNNSAIDYIVQGEGEEAFAKLIEELEVGNNETYIAGVRGQRSDGTLFGSTEIVEVANLDDVPFPYNEADMESLKHRIVYYESSRGCPFSCQYCLSGNKNKVRFFSTERTLKELQWFIDHGVKQVKFVDRTFNCSARHHMPILEFLTKADTKTNFHLEMEGVLLTEKEVNILTTSPKGRFQIEVGVQSTHEPTLEAIRRCNKWEHISKMIKPIIEAGRTHVHMDLIIGLPHESKEIFKHSFADLFALKPQALQLGFLKLLKGSGVRSMKEFEYVYDPKAPYEVLSTHVMTYKDIRFLKVFEDVFETFFNGEKYSRTFNTLHSILMKNMKEDSLESYTFFEKLTEYWISCGYDRIKLNDHDKSIFLYKGIQEVGMHMNSIKPWIAVLQDMVRIDTLISFKGKIKSNDLDLPAYDKEMLRASESFWQQEAVVQQYISHYKFKEWRHVRQNFYELNIADETKAFMNLQGNHVIIDVEGKVLPFARPNVDVN